MLKLYFYTGYTRKGKFILGFSRGNDEKDVRKKIKSEDIFSEKLYYIPFFTRKEKLEDVIMIFTQSKMFIKNGYSFQRIFEILGENRNLRFYINKMKDSLRNGESLHEMFKNSGLNLKASEYTIIKSGEESGNIYQAFEIIEKGMRDREKAKKEILKIMFYPLTVFIMIIFLIIFTGIYILPDFIKIIKASSQSPPLITRFIIFFADNFIFIVSVGIFILIIITGFLKKKKLREKLFQKFMKVNIFKYIEDKIFISNFTYVLGILLASGITITEAVKILKEETDNVYFEKRIEESEKHLRKGKSIGKSFEKMEVFSKIDLELINSGEESGELVDTLFAVSSRNKEYLQEKLQLGIKVLEPMSIIIIGIITGLIFLGIYLPIFQMMDNI